MRNKRHVLTCMIILLTVVFYYTVEAQQKNVTHRTKFSGEWKTKEPLSIGGIATVTATDLKTGNGVVHVINAVVLPK